MIPVRGDRYDMEEEPSSNDDKDNEYEDNNDVNNDVDNNKA